MSTRTRSSAAARSGAARGAGDARQRLLQAGRRLAERDGLRALTVRGTAARARVNLGSFVHHFGTREAFVDALIEAWYAPFMARLQITVDEAAPPPARLRALLQQVADFLLANRRFIGHLLMDAAAGEPAARRFLASLSGRHPQLLLRVIAEAQRAGSLPAREPPLHLLLYLMAAIGAPVLMGGAAAASGLLPREVAAQLAALAADPESAARRIDWALRGIVTAGVRP